MAAATVASPSGSAPTWFARLTSGFPLVTYDAVPSIHTTATPLLSRPTRPLLLVEQGHPIARRQGQTTPTYTWASRDPDCLAWQMQLLFRGADVECLAMADERHTTRLDGEGFSRRPMLLDRDGTVVHRRHLDRWADTVAPLSSDVQQSASTSQAKMLDSVIRGPLLAGVLLEMLLLPEPPLPTQKRLPILTRQVQASVMAQRRARIVRQIQALRHESPTSRMPRWITNLHGLLNVRPTGALAGAIVVEEEEAWETAQAESLSAGLMGVGSVEVEQLDRTAIQQEACEAVQIVAGLMAHEHEWLCGAPAPTPLDAHLFALLHTALSLPVVEGTPSPLRITIQAAPNLVSYVRRIHAQFVGPQQATHRSSSVH